MKKIYILFAGLALLPSVTGCFSLEKEPEVVISTSTVFRTTGEMEKYLNNFYNNAFRGHPSTVNGTGIANPSGETPPTQSTAPIRQD